MSPSLLRSKFSPNFRAVVGQFHRDERMLLTIRRGIHVCVQLSRNFPRTRIPHKKQPSPVNGSAKGSFVSSETLPPKRHGARVAETGPGSALSCAGPCGRPGPHGAAYGPVARSRDQNRSELGGEGREDPNEGGTLRGEHPAGSGPTCA